MTPVQGGFSLHLDLEGRIIGILRDEGGLAADIEEGTLLPTLVERGCMGKCIDFLLEIRDKGAAFDREFPLSVGGVGMGLHFSGSRANQGMVVTASTTQAGTEVLLEELAKICAEQSDLIRQLRKDGSSRAGNQPPAFEAAPKPPESAPPRQPTLSATGAESDFDSQFYDEISRLNNELINAQRELAQKNAELGRFDEFKNRFLGMAAHDLRAPLSVCLAYIDFLTDEPDIDTETRLDWIAKIRSSMQFMLTLVNDLLDTAAIESGSLRLELRPADLASLVADLVETNRLLSGKRGVKIERNDCPVPVTAMVDPVRIGQAINNLVSNAAKFSNEGGTVVVTLEADEDIVVAVTDRGKGMDKATLDRLFTPFGSATVRTESGEKNTGLGLVIARRIAEAHGGSLLVKSDVGKGTRVELRLPSARRPAEGRIS
jgi:signal transduction histidine kinase